ncbi:MAG TPA: TOBE domain-containing protein, partial [Thermopetrobacter sp.]|nr:TOBE domain-containing protein [Thermopetrobacter sp.]
AGNDEFIVKIPNAADEKHLKVGQAVRLGWKTSDCRALDP